MKYSEQTGHNNLLQRSQVNEATLRSRQIEQSYKVKEIIAYRISKETEKIEEN